MAGRILTALQYSGGVQSEWLLWMVLLGIIPKPKHFAVFNADPGMENENSARFVDAMRNRCEKAGIDFITARGPNLLQDILNLKKSGATRLDNPPFWTKSANGKLGKIKQKCTRHYKVAPMDREVRIWIYNHWGILPNNTKWLGTGSVEKWVGFSYDEKDRAEGLLKQKHAKFVRFTFPLIEAGLTKSDISREFARHGIEEPDHSICDSCPFNGLRRLKTMHDTQPDRWRRAVKVDESIRDLSQIGVKEECYVSSTLIPLRQLAEMDFKLDSEVKTDLHQCSSGVCFNT